MAYKPAIAILQLAMYKNTLYILLVFVLFLGTSCKSLRKISSTDKSTFGQSTKRKVGNGQPEFLENISVNPGSVVTSKHKTSGIKKTPEQYTKATLEPSTIEQADWLQFKYAIVTNTNIESLENIPLLQKIDEWWGTKYCLGGSTKNCIDCSGFTTLIMKEVYKLQLPRTAQEQYNMSEKISITDIKEGDMIFFGTSTKRISHVGIYIANNKFLHASTSVGVTITNMDDKYWAAKFKGFGRVL